MQVFLVKPRGFCAGVRRAIQILEGVIDKYKTKIYVHHEIVHNNYVLNYFKNKDVIFVSDVKEIPKNSIVVFSAHGVSNEVEEEAKSKNLTIFDATCPLVKKVHKLAQKYDKEGNEIILIGHKNHAEVIGTVGKVSKKIHIVESENDIKNINFKENTEISLITQTTLSIDDTTEMTKKLNEKFPQIKKDNQSNICYATQNRQNAIKSIIKNLDLLIILGSKSSSNSNRLKDIGLKSGIDSYLIDEISQIKKEWFKKKKAVGISSGASAPEILVKDVVNYILSSFNATLVNYKNEEELVEFYVNKDFINVKSTLIDL